MFYTNNIEKKTTNQKIQKKLESKYFKLSRMRNELKCDGIIALKN